MLLPLSAIIAIGGNTSHGKTQSTVEYTHDLKKKARPQIKLPPLFSIASPSLLQSRRSRAHSDGQDRISNRYPSVLF